MAAESEATLELTIHSADNLTDKETPKFLTKSKTLAIAWLIDDHEHSSSSKQKTPKDLHAHPDQKLHLPLTSRTLCDPTSALAIQILSTRHLQNPKLLGTATLPLSSLGLAAAPVRLQLRNPDGGAHGCGSVRVSARVLWWLGPVPPDAPDAVPSAPPMPEDEPAVAAEVETDCADVGPALPHRSGGGCEWRSFFAGMDCADVGPALPHRSGGGCEWRSFFAGMVSGALIVVLVGGIFRGLRMRPLARFR